MQETNNAESFLSFYAFFHRSAFEPGPASLDALLKESAAYARGVGESLKVRCMMRSRSWGRGSSTSAATH